MIKNWYVEHQQIKSKAKGLINHINYLKDKNRPSHYYTNIKILLDNSKQILNAANERSENRKNKSLGGGGVKNLASSLIFTIPRTVNQASKNQWSVMLNSVFKDLAVDINKAIVMTNNKESANRDNPRKPNHKYKPFMPEITYEDLKAHAMVVLHDESASPNKNSHCHILISNVIKNEVIKPISQKCCSYSAKKAFNKAVLRVLNEDTKDYVPLHKKSFNKPLWVAHEEQAKNLEVKLSNLKKAFKNIKNDIKTWSKTFLNNIFSIAEIRAEKVAIITDDIESISPSIADDIDCAVDEIETQNINAPDVAKVSTKRKRRRRKKLNT